MNLPEFKAWFEGFTENLSGAPTKTQWIRICEKIGKIADAPPTTVQHFHDYWKPWRRWYDGPYYGASAIGTPLSSAGVHRQMDALLQAKAEAMQGHSVPQMQYASQNEMQSCGQNMAAEFDAGAAFKALGRAEAKSMVAR